jgi:hypothetical protein
MCWYGNMFGAQLSTTVPVILNEVHYDDVHYMSLAETDCGTMLRLLGVLIFGVR